jgi:hypothetical protein
MPRRRTSSRRGIACAEAFHCSRRRIVDRGDTRVHDRVRRSAPVRNVVVSELDVGLVDEATPFSLS